MTAEYLVVGIARGNDEDFKEFYKLTSKGAFSFALVLTGDRVLAREAAAESYRRVVSEAKNFDAAMSAKIWHLEMVRNLCLNGLADGEIARQASLKRRDNLSILLSSALFGTSEDRGKIIAARLGAGLSGSEAAGLLWYNSVSLAGEYRRVVKEAAELAGLKGEDAVSIGEAEQRLRQDFESAVPDYFELAKGGRETSFSNINGTMLLSLENEGALPGESREDRQKRLAAKTVTSARRKVIVTVCIIAAILLAVTIPLTVFLVNQSRTLLEDPEENTYEIEEPQYKTTVPCLIAGGRVFYSNYADNDALWARNISTGASEKISDVIPKDFSAVTGDICYFRDAAKGELCTLNVKTLEITRLGIKGALPCIIGEDLVYSSQNGVSKLSGGEITEIFTDTSGSVLRFDMAVMGDIVLFSSPAEGLFRLTPTETGDYYCDNSMAGSQINYFDVSGKYVVFDDGSGALYVLDMDSGRLLPRIKASLLSGAFYTANEIIYFYGKTETGAKGVYKISIADADAEKEPEFLFGPANGKYDVTDIYADGDLFLLYYSNGQKQSGAYNELVLKNLSGKEERIFKK